MSRVIILAAGRGSRMGSETDSKPKCLTILKGKRLLDWQIESLAKAELNEVLIIGGYKHEMLQNRGFELIKNERWNKTNMVASLLCAPSTKQDTIISYADIVYSPAHLEKLKASKHDISITADKDWLELWSLRFENPLDDAETFKSNDNTLTSIGNKTNDVKDIEAQYMGLLKVTPKGWATILKVCENMTQIERDKLDMTSLLNSLLQQDIPVHVVFVNGKWCEVDNYSDVVVYEKELNKINTWTHDWRN
jgi:choline kinase